MSSSDDSRSENSIRVKKARSRTISLFEGGAYAASDGFGLRNISPYAIALNASNSMMSLLISIPSFLGNLSQLLTYNLLRNRSRKRVIVTGVFLQAFFWLLLLIPGLIYLNSTKSSNLAVITLVILYTGLVISGSIPNPAWSSLMQDIVPKNQLGRYFGKRNRITVSITLVCMLIGAFVLDYFKKTEVIYGFLILVLLSFIFRSISGFLHSKKYEPPFKRSRKAYFSFFRFIRNMPFNNFGRFVVFVALINFSVAIASPFFAAYLLRDRSFTYISYMTLMVLIPLASVLTMPYWGRLSDKWGNVNILRVATITIIFIPFAYLISSYFSSFWIVFGLLFVAELIGGIGWAGFNLAINNFVFRTVSKERIVICSSYMNAINGFSIFIGATLGGVLASFNFWNPILAVFFFSGIGRLLAYITMVPKLKERTLKKSVYSSEGSISFLIPLQRVIHSMSDITYFKKTIDSLNRSKLARRF